MYECMYARVCGCVYVFMYVCKYMCMRVCMYVCMNVRLGYILCQKENAIRESGILKYCFLWVICLSMLLEWDKMTNYTVNKITTRFGGTSRRLYETSWSATWQFGFWQMRKLQIWQWSVFRIFLFRSYKMTMNSLSTRINTTGRLQLGKSHPEAFPHIWTPDRALLHVLG